ncbi:hypothetical protein R1sor_004352 [Riccia sorocarpa]|uniref:Uncharacterized protein n=1 Tax=Riccia sorocarpa TaxID=122646 RepID=A0ABD3HKS2_9MARC
MEIEKIHEEGQQVGNEIAGRVEKSQSSGGCRVHGTKTTVRIERDNDTFQAMGPNGPAKSRSASTPMVGHGHPGSSTAGQKGGDLQQQNGRLWASWIGRDRNSGRGEQELDEAGNSEFRSKLEEKTGTADVDGFIHVSAKSSLKGDKSKEAERSHSNKGQNRFQVFTEELEEEPEVSIKDLNAGERRHEEALKCNLASGEMLRPVSVESGVGYWVQATPEGEGGDTSQGLPIAESSRGDAENDKGKKCTEEEKTEVDRKQIDKTELLKALDEFHAAERQGHDKDSFSPIC